MQGGRREYHGTLKKTSLFFAHPRPPGRGGPILPVFLPQAGCAGRCLFCHQAAQTGTPSRPLDQVLEDLRAALDAVGPARAVEVAFYGGTFTALAGDWPERFVSLAAGYKARGRVTRIRCSTRPDAVDAARIERLARAGLDTVELGVQTFDATALALCRRGHDAAASRRACGLVREAGLGLGVHLMAGLPGHGPDSLDRDTAECLALRPDFVRLSPCLVLAGAELADWWRTGRYAPWTLDRAVPSLARAALALWRAGVAVARVGLAPEPSLIRAILAGPWAEDLGMRVGAAALLADITRRLDGRRAARLVVPARHSGGFWGHAGELEGAYAALGLSRRDVSFRDVAEFVLEIRDE